MLLCTSIEPTQYEVSVAISLSFRCNWQPSGRACENFLLSTVSYCRRSGPTETPAHTHSLKSCPRSDTHSTSTSSLPRRPRPDAATTSDTPVFIMIREPLGSWGHARVRAPRLMTRRLLTSPKQRIQVPRVRRGFKRLSQLIRALLLVVAGSAICVSDHSPQLSFRLLLSLFHDRHIRKI